MGSGSRSIMRGCRWTASRAITLPRPQRVGSGKFAAAFLLQHLCAAGNEPDTFRGSRVGVQHRPAPTPGRSPPHDACPVPSAQSSPPARDRPAPPGARRRPAARPPAARPAVPATRRAAPSARSPRPRRPRRSNAAVGRRIGSEHYGLVARGQLAGQARGDPGAVAGQHPRARRTPPPVPVPAPRSRPDPAARPPSERGTPSTATSPNPASPSAWRHIAGLASA